MAGDATVCTIFTTGFHKHWNKSLSWFQRFCDILRWGGRWQGRCGLCRDCWWEYRAYRQIWQRWVCFAASVEAAFVTSRGMISVVRSMSLRNLRRGSTVLEMACKGKDVKVSQDELFKEGSLNAISARTSNQDCWFSFRHVAVVLVGSIFLIFSFMKSTWAVMRDRNTESIKRWSINCYQLHMPRKILIFGQLYTDASDWLGVFTCVYKIRANGCCLPLSCAHHSSTIYRCILIVGWLVANGWSTQLD